MIRDEGVRRMVALIIIVGMVGSVALAGIASYYASSSPDGLESVAQQQGFADSAQDSASSDSPLADYGVESVSDERLSVGLAGVIGVGVTALVAFALFLLLGSRSRQARSADVKPDPRG